MLQLFRALKAHAHQCEHDGRSEDDDQSTNAVKQAADEPFWIRREDTSAEIGDADDKQPPDPKASGSCMNLVSCCGEQSERNRSQTEEGERHQPAKAAQLVFADEMGRVELWLQQMKHGENDQESEA